jgi:hypothetical protein
MPFTPEPALNYIFYRRVAVGDVFTQSAPVISFLCGGGIYRDIKKLPQDEPPSTKGLSMYRNQS